MQCLPRHERAATLPLINKHFVCVRICIGTAFASERVELNFEWIFDGFKQLRFDATTEIVETHPVAKYRAGRRQTRREPALGNLKQCPYNVEASRELHRTLGAADRY